MKKYVKCIPETIGIVGGFSCIAYGYFQESAATGITLILWGTLTLIMALSVRQDRKIDELTSLVEQLTCDEVDDEENP